MTKTSEFEGLDRVRQLLRTVEARKSNFDYNLTLLQRERDLMRLKSAWESICHEGPDSERGRARYLVSKSIAASQSEIQKSVDKGLQEERAKIQDAKAKKPVTGRNEKSAPSPSVRSKFPTSSRLLRAKASSCERCQKKSQLSSPASKPSASPKAVDVASRRPKFVQSVGAENAPLLPLRPEPSGRIAVLPRFLTLLRPPASLQHRFSTRSVLSEKAARLEERREAEKRRNEAFVSVAIWQRNNIPTSCKATSTSSLRTSKNKKPGSSNVGIETAQHSSAKPELKIQVLPSVQIKSSYHVRPFPNVRYVEHARDVVQDSAGHEDVAKPSPSKDDDQSPSKKPGKIQLTKELTEKVVALCKEKMTAGFLPENKSVIDPSPQAPVGDLVREDGSPSPKEEVHGDNFGGKLREETADVSSESKTSSSSNSYESTIPTPVPTPAPSPSPVASPPLDHRRVVTPPSSRCSSSEEAEPDFSGRDEHVFTPGVSQSDPGSGPGPEIPALLEETEEPSGAAPDEGTASKSAISEHGTREPQPKTEREVSFRLEDDYSVGQVPFRADRGGRWPSDPEPQRGGEGSSASSTPEGIEQLESEADLTNLTASTTYSEGEVKPFRLHRLRNFDQMLALLSRAQLSRPSSLGQIGFQERTEADRRPSSLPDGGRSEKSLGEVEAGAQDVEEESRVVATEPPQECVSEGEIHREP